MLTLATLSLSPYAMMINIGIMGHVDSGKTSLAKWLSCQASTAAFDKSPASQERGITLDLGFSRVDLNNGDPSSYGTIVDCPGHGSLIRHVIGGAAVMDAAMIVIDAQRGVQTQTAECIVLAELAISQVVIVVNKIDLLGDVDLAVKRIKRQLEHTAFKDSPIVLVSAKMDIGKQALIDQLSELTMKKRDRSKPLLIAIDHGFIVKKGCVVTGTILQGHVKVNDQVIIPEIGNPCKVKSIQSFKTSLMEAHAGDRVGISLEGPVVKIERSVAYKPNDQSLKMSDCFLMKARRVKYFKSPLHSSQKIHISILHETVLCRQVIFVKEHPNGEYEWLDGLEDTEMDLQAIVMLDAPIPVPRGIMCIASKLDMPVDTKACRIAFYGEIIENNLVLDDFPVFKSKLKETTIDRIVDNKRVIAKPFPDCMLINKYVGWRVRIGNTIDAIIQSAFGQSGKFNLQLLGGDGSTTLNTNDPIRMHYKRYPLRKGKPAMQDPGHHDVV